MATLVAKVRGISGSSSSITANTKVVEYLKGGAQFVINGTPITLLDFAANSTATVSNANGYTLTTNKVYSVRRNEIMCDKMPVEYDYANQGILSNTTSIVKASTIHPKYVIRGRK